jgi:dTDP-4-dehydrorhamnose reductase
MWGGIECTVNRVGDRFQDQFEWSGHPQRLQDLDRIAELGIEALRTPVLWERVAPEYADVRNWDYPDASLARLRELGISPIVGLVHHGSGPRYTSLLDDEFPEKLAAHARAVAERYPWVEAYTPVNEILTTARFSALYGHWHPHTTDERSFGRALLNEARATVLAMEAIRQVNPSARLIQTDDLGKTHATPPVQYQADLENERRWLGWDLLCGKVAPGSPMWDYLVAGGTSPEALRWHLDHVCPPDVLGVNHYISSERFLDHRLEHHAPETHGGNGKDRYADVLAARVRHEGCVGFEGVLTEAWERYGIPLAVTECHMGCTREEQMRWLVNGWYDAHLVRERGAEIVGFTVWSLTGAFDWNCLLTQWTGCYEPGVFDLRAPEPRPTALAGVIRQLARGEEPMHPALAGDGWWQRDIRFEHPPVATNDAPAPAPRAKKAGRSQPILISGATGTLGRAFARLCELRGLSYRILARDEMDVADPASVECMLKTYRPWAVVNAAGYVRVDDAERESARCYRENTAGPAVLAGACLKEGVRLVTFSSDLVFDGAKGAAYVESDAANPLNVYGRSKVEAERCVLSALPEALVVRTSAFFGPWDEHHFAFAAVRAAMNGEPFVASRDRHVSPTYVPDLVNATLDLLIDGETGVWHLANQGAVSEYEFARRVLCALDLGDHVLRPGETGNAPRPANSTLASERGWVMPSLDAAIARYASEIAPRLPASRFTWR